MIEESGQLTRISAPKMNQGQQVQGRTHRCQSCDRVFARAEHLRRHCLSHENRKPNICRGCGSRFGRSDVLRRHTRKCSEFQRMLAGGRNENSESDRSDQQRRLVTWEGAIPADTSSGAGSLDHNNILDSMFGSPQSGGQLFPLEPGVDQPLTGGSSMAVLPGTPAIPDNGREYLGTGSFDDLGFLEDFLLPDCTMIPGVLMSAANVEDGSPMFLSGDHSHLGHYSSRTRTPVSSFRTTAATLQSTLDEPSYLKVLSTSSHEVEEFRKRLYCIGPHGNLKSFRFPSQSRIVRCIVSYFDHFDRHTPIIQHTKFSLCGTHPALVLMILAIGAMYLSEHDFARTAYEVACSMLGECPFEQAKQDPSQYDFAPLQAVLLCAQFGAFSGNEANLQRSQRQFASVSEVLKDGLYILKAELSATDQNWERWSFIETYSRLAAWTCTLSAMLLANDPTSAYMAPYQLREVPLPQDEELWQARSAAQWAAKAGRTKLHGDTTLAGVADSLLQGTPIPENISSFALLSLVAWVLTYICTQERLAASIGPVALFHGDFKTQMERVLSGWETYTRRRVKADRVIYRQSDPLFTDCFPMFTSAYYHLYLGSELRALKEKAARDGQSMGGSRSTSLLSPITSLQSSHKALMYAANSWLVRAKQGIGHFNDTAAINYGCHSLITAYETALILSWWLSVSNSPEFQDSRGKYAAVVNPISEILSEAFAEVEDQGIICEDSDSRALGPLLFTQRCISKSVYPFSRHLEQKIRRFTEYIRLSSASG